jgi:Dolichyl-phosphate-mannose-protein mannosyltransferase
VSRTIGFLLITIGVGALLRFYGLDHGAPWHFHADEMLALRGAELLRAAPHVAAESARFFIYPVLPKELLAVVVNAWETIARPLDLAKPADGKVVMMLGRVLSASVSTLTIPVVFAAARRVAGDVAGLVSAALMACAVIAIVNAHYFTSDSLLTFFCALSLLAIVQIAQGGGWRAYVFAGVSLGLALASKYTAAFLLLPLALAHVVAPGRPNRGAGARVWINWILTGATPLAVAAAVFAAVNPLVLAHWDRFLADVYEGIVQPNFQGDGPIWTAQFADVARRSYWFTNLLPWTLGPAFAVCALAGIVWAFARRERGAIAVAGYLLLYYAIAAQTTTPYARYVLPAVPGLAVAAGLLCADLWRRDRQRKWARAATAGVVATTALWAIAYMNVYRREDVRLTAAKFINLQVPEGASILVEPSHNTPPTGSYWRYPEFFTDYVGWGAGTVRRDRYALHTLDVYRHLYDRTLSPDEKRQYIRDRLALVNYIVMDDTFEEFYAHLHGPEHAPVREYYRDLFSGALGFTPMRRFKVHPSLFGLEIVDDSAEMTFSLFDHPTVHVFARRR